MCRADGVGEEGERIEKLGSLSFSGKRPGSLL